MKFIHRAKLSRPEKERVFRIEVVETFLKAGVPLSKISKFRSLLEKHATRLAEPHCTCPPYTAHTGREKDVLKSVIGG